MSMSTTPDPNPFIPIKVSPPSPTPPTSLLAPPAPIETPPSPLMQEIPSLPRMIGFLGLFLLILGLVVVISTRILGDRLIPVAWGFEAVAFGLVLMLFHAMSDGELEVRRMYGGGAACLFILAVVVSLIPGPFKASEKAVGYFMMPWGELAALAGLLFTVAFCRHETDEWYQTFASTVLLLFGGLMAVGSLTAGIFKPEFLAGPGITMALLGLAFLAAYLAHVDTSSGLGYTVAFTLGAVGALVALYALGRVIFPTVLYDGPTVLRKPDQTLDMGKAFGRGLVILGFLALVTLGALGRFPIWLRASIAAIGLVGAGVFAIACFDSPLSIPAKPFLVPGGVILTLMGLIYLGVSLGYCSDNQLVTLTRRELSSYFLSPIGFLVLGGMALGQWLSYLQFVGQLSDGRPLREPIVQGYAAGILNLFLYTVQIPILTMRLLAEEKRTGSLEVLLTAPVNESSIVIGKFIATLIFYLICWVPSGLFLIALRVEGDQPFDYRPLLGFYVGLAAQGAMFISMGLFFSSLTKNQIVAALMSFVVMLCLLFMAIWRENPLLLFLPDVFMSAIGRLSFYHMWVESLSGQLPIRDVLLSISLAVFGVFLTVKVLEIRKWS